MSAARHRHIHRMTVAVIAFAAMFLIGWMPAGQVWAQEISTGLPYDQSWENNSGKSVSDTFEYLMEADDSKSPMPSQGGTFELKGNAEGELPLTFSFERPGYYHYKVTPQTEKTDSHYTCDRTVYYLTFMVVNGDSGLTLRSITIADSDNAKYPALEYKNSYYVEPPTTTTQPTNPTNPTQTTTQRNNGNGNANPGAPGQPGQPAPAATQRPGQTIDGNDIPLHHMDEPDYWALLNLILMIMTVLLCLADILLYLRKEDEEKEDLDILKRKRRKLLIRIATIVPAVISVIMFIRTEDMKLPMKWVDEWTIWMVILLIICMLLAFTTRVKKDGDEDDTG